MVEWNLAQAGVDIETVDIRRMLSLVLGWLLDGRTAEQQQELLDKLDKPELNKRKDAAVAESYREDGYSDLRIQMLEEMRSATSPAERVRIRQKFMARAAEQAPGE